MEIGAYTINLGMVLGFVTLFITLVFVHILARYIIKSRALEENRKKTLIVLKDVAGYVYISVIILFFIAMLWTGWGPTPTNKNEAGVIETDIIETDIPASVNDKEAINRPDIKSKELRKEAEELQDDSMKKLQDFRRKMKVNEDVNVPIVRDKSSVNEPNKSN